jgi:phage terminase large subunit
MSDGFKRGVLLWGRQCLAPETLVQTDRGYPIPVADLIVGDKVLSYSEKLEYKPVINIWKYGVDDCPKPMIQCKVYEEEISCTYDHPFYFRGVYVPLYQLAWRTMGEPLRNQLKLLCEQYGETIDYEAIRWVSDGCYETSEGCQWLSEDSSGRKDSKDSSVSSRELDRQSTKQSDSQSQKWNKNGQQSRESGVDDTSGEHSALPRHRDGIRPKRGELRESFTNRNPGERDIILPVGIPDDSKTDDGERVTSILPASQDRFDSRYTEGQELEVTEVRILPSAITYGIDVADNHNYFITDSNILVGNSGKTYFATQHAWISAIKDQGRYFIVFKTYKQAHEVVWRAYVPLIPKELIYKKNEQDLLIEFNYIKGAKMTLPSGEEITINHDETLPRSSLQFLGSDQSDSHRGFKGHGMIFDEYADQDPNNWDAVYKHFFTTTDGWAIFMGTPRGYNHFYDLIQYAKEDPRWFYLESTWRDSPFVKKEFIEQERKEATKKGTLSTFLQEVELEFRAVQGAVYPLFDRNVHVIKPADVPLELTYYGAIDFGWHTTAFLLLGVDKDQNWYLIDEVYGKEETLDNILPRIKAVIGDKRLVLVVGDSANRDAIEVMGRTYPMVGVNKANDIRGYGLGIALVTEKLKPRAQLIGPPKPTLFIGSNCNHFIYELEAYRFPEDKPERNPSDIPIKEDDHGPDALRYLFLHLKYGIQKDDKPLEFDMQKQSNEFGLL